MLCRRRIGSWLYLGRAGLLLEDGIVAKTLALALLTVSTGRMRFVALCTVNVSARATEEGRWSLRCR